MNINEQHNSYQPCVKTQWIWGRQEKMNEKNQCFKGWETLVHNFTEKYVSKIYKQTAVGKMWGKIR